MNQGVSSLDLSPGVVRAFRQVGIIYCKDVTSADLHDKKISEETWRNLRTAPSSKTALDLYLEQVELGSITLLTPSLDEALGGGVQIGQITEFAGLPGTGKTQICLQLCVNVQLPEWCGGLDGEAMYISTNHSFPAHRLREIAANSVENYTRLRNSEQSTLIDDEAFQVDRILQKVHCFRAHDVAELLAMATYLEKWILDHKLRVLIIDSITVPLMQVFKYTDRRPIVYTLLGDLQKLATEHKFAIVVTNNMTTRTDLKNQIVVAPALGESFFHRINTRVLLSKSSANHYKANVEKSVMRKQTEVEFELRF